MSRGLYMDVLTAQEDGSARLPDSDLLDRAAVLGRLVFSRDSDFLGEGVRRLRAGLPFATIVYAHQQDVSIGRCVMDLEIIGRASTPGEAM